MIFRTLGFDIRFTLKKRLWFLAIAFLTFFFALPIRAGIKYQSFIYATDVVTLESLTNNLTGFFSQSDVIMICIFSILAIAAGILNFVDMNKGSQVDFYNSLPFTKTHIFAVNYLCGLLSVTIPYIFNLLLTLIILAVMGFGPFLSANTILAGVGIHLLFFLLIYSTVILATVFCGKTSIGILMSAFFLAVGPAVILLYRYLRRAFQPTWYDQLTDWDGLLTHSSPVARYIVNSPIPWWEILLMIALTALITWIAVLLFRRRPSEAAGHALAFPKSRAFFKYPITIIAAAAFALFFHDIGDSVSNGNTSWLWFFIGALLGSFIIAQTIEIIFHADFRAIGKKLLPLAFIFGAFSGCCLLLIGDVGGFNSYLPDKDDVTAVEVRFNNFNDYVPAIIHNNDYLYNYASQRENSDNQQLQKYLSTEQSLQRGFSEDPAAIAAAISIAEKFLAQEGYLDCDCAPAESQNSYGQYDRYGNYIATIYPQSTDMVIRYTLSNGKEVSRIYNTSLPIADIRDELCTIYDDPAYRQQKYYLAGFDPSQVRLDYLEFYTTGNYYSYSLKADSNETMTSNYLLNYDVTELFNTYCRELLAMDSTVISREMPIGYLVFDVFADPAEGTYKELQKKECLQFEYPIYERFSGTLAALEQFGITEEAWQLDYDSIISLQLTTYSLQEADSNDTQVQKEISDAQNLFSAAAPYTTPDTYTSVQGNIQRTSYNIYYDEAYYTETAESITYYPENDMDIILDIMGRSYSEYSFWKNCMIDAKPDQRIQTSYQAADGSNNWLTFYFIAQ